MGVHLLARLVQRLRFAVRAPDFFAAPVRLRLLPFNRADLGQLALGLKPHGLTGNLLPEALPPSFVAQRSWAQLEAGKSEFWCTGFCIVDVDAASIVGSCGFKNEPHNGQVEIGYGISPSARNKGYATAAVAELLALARSPGGARAVLAQVNAENLPSTRVVQKLLFQPNGQKLDDEAELLVQWVYTLSR